MNAFARRLPPPIVILASGLALIAAVPPGASAQPGAKQQTVGTFSDWSAVVDTIDGKKVCYIGSTPKKAEGNYTTRGETHVLITHRPADRVSGEASVTAGYTYKEKSSVEVDIDGRTFQLFTQGGNAWTRDAGADRALVDAMRAGRQMIVRGTSSRGTLTTDTYSLAGFTAALNAITTACAK